MPKSPRRSGFAEAPQTPFEGAPFDTADLSADAELLKALGRGSEAGAEARKKAEAKPKGKRRQVQDHEPAPDPQKAPRGFGSVNETDVGMLPADFDPSKGVSATVAALEHLIQHGRPELQGKPWVPHRPERPEKLESGQTFVLKSD